MENRIVNIQNFICNLLKKEYLVLRNCKQLSFSKLDSYLQHFKEFEKLCRYTGKVDFLVLPNIY